MESSDDRSGGRNNNNGVGGSRWNPTKEQVSMLENLYNQGVRTPNTEEIQQITARLRAFGHIEGKNVFYWFQNHKARQRQKEKQETFAYFNRFLHSPPLIFSPPPLCPNVICRPYYVPHSEMGYAAHQQHPKVLLPATGTGISRLPRNCEAYPQMHQDRTVTSGNHIHGHLKHIETLALFPLQPTGFLEDKTNSFSADAAPAHHHNDEEDNGQQGNQPIFDFFSSSGQEFLQRK